MTFVIHANLDQEARWSGLALPAHVQRRISAASALLAVLAPADADVEVFAPAPVDAARVRLAPAPAMRVGVPARTDLAWADPSARGVNDRRFALDIARELDIALPGSRVIASVAELDGGWPARWVAKAVWTAAGRDRARGEGAPTGELRARILNLVTRGGAVVVEPWLDRVLDVGVTSRVGAPPSPPHTLLVDARGGFVGIDLRAPALTADETARLAEVVTAADSALARAGYAGPFTVDAFVYRREDGTRALHALCELNARYTFGHVARALGGIVLGFGPPPAGARVLVATTADDPFTAWHHAG